MGKRGSASLPDEPMLRGEFIRWMEEERGYSPITRRTRLVIVDRAERYMKGTFGRRLIRAMPDHLRPFLGKFSHPRTRNGVLAALRCYYAFALERRYRATDPTAGFKRLPTPKLLPRPLSLEQVKRLRAAAATMSLRHRVIVDVTLFSGARRAEVAGLQWSDIDLGGRRIRFYGKGAKEGVVPLHPTLAALLEVWRCMVPASEWVFPSNRGGGHLKPASIWREFHEAAGRAGIKATTHQGRHTFATELLDHDSDVRRVQELLRHASLASTEIYTKVAVKRLEADISRLDYGT